MDEVHSFCEAALAQKVASLGGFFQKETAVKPVGLAQVFLVRVFSPLDLSALPAECLSHRAGLGQSQGPRQASVRKLRRAAGVRVVRRPCHQHFQPEFTLATSDHDLGLQKTLLMRHKGPVLNCKSPPDVQMLP